MTSPDPRPSTIAGTPTATTPGSVTVTADEIVVSGWTFVGMTLPEGAEYARRWAVERLYAERPPREGDGLTDYERGYERGHRDCDGEWHDRLDAERAARAGDLLRDALEWYASGDDGQRARDALDANGRPHFSRLVEYDESRRHHFCGICHKPVYRVGTKAGWEHDEEAPRD